MRELTAANPDATIGIDVPGACALRGTEPRLRAVFGELLENAVEHHPGPAPTVSVSLVDAEGETATITVVDDGPGIPAHETRVLSAAEETALEHGSGLGLWQVAWGVRALGGSVAFSSDDGGTTATLELPRADDG